jgi:hypothetical protein
MIPSTNENLISNSELSQLQSMVQRQLKLEDEVETLEEELKEKKKEYNTVRQEEIPNFLTQFGLSEIKLSDGSKVEVKGDVAVTIKDQEAFFKFLIERHDDAIIKKVLSMDDPPDELVDDLIEKGYPISYDKKIHAQTLKAYFRTFMELGETPPESVNVFAYSYAKIKRAEKKE